MSDKRKVSTDALETLGTIFTEGERDAIHLAVEPVIAGESIRPGQDITIRDGQAYGANGYLPDEKMLGIADPFLKNVIRPGQKFWLVVYPRQITSLRHVWSHPDFPESIQPHDQSGISDPVEASKAWITAFAAELDQTYSRLMRAADQWYYDNDCTYDNSEVYKDHYHKFPEFWEHYKIVTGREPSGKDSFFTCSC